MLNLNSLFTSISNNWAILIKLTKSVGMYWYTILKRWQGLYPTALPTTKLCVSWQHVQLSTYFNLYFLP